MSRQNAIGALILAGGKNRRMNGIPKALLPLQNGTYLSHLEQQLSIFSERLISVNDPAIARKSAFYPVADRFPGCGPLSGIYSALFVCQSGALFVVSCDLPRFTKDFAQYLCGLWDGRDDALVCRTRDGRLHPLCGIYRKACLPVLHQCLLHQTFRMADCLGKLACREVQMGGSPFPDSILQNINTPEEAQMLRL